jgi:type II secretory ATPase GspE/PulE/Tfp pilus assembly ATPase PilB-like protein
VSDSPIDQLLQSFGKSRGENPADKNKPRPRTNPQPNAQENKPPANKSTLAAKDSLQVNKPQKSTSGQSFIGSLGQSDDTTKVETPVKVALPIAIDNNHLTETHSDQGFNGDGELLTAEGGPLAIPAETRKICALFSNGLFLVSESHKNSPLVRSVVSLARRQNYQVNEPPQFVTPAIIHRAYMAADRDANSNKFDDNAMRRRINHVLAEAVNLNANDIHVDTSNGQCVIQLRIDGSLRIWEVWTKSEGEQFIASVWSHADVASGVSANWNEPLAATLSHKSGPDTLTLPEDVGGVRCQWMPLVDGRYLNMRLNYDGGKTLGSDIEQADVDTLGFNAEQTALSRHLRHIPGAMRMIAGPVNQGKTTTLRIMLNRRMFETEFRLNCLMVEDPPEGGVKGARQIGVSSVTDEKLRARLLSEVMRASLRLDPDIVMLGEIRDFETATMAFRLALTGRQVYTTLHVYAALAIPQRIRDLGIEPYLVYDHHLLRGLFSQRLSRKLCEHCKIPAKDAAKVVPNYAEVMERTRAGYAMMRYNRQFGFEKNDNKTFEEVDMDNIFFSNTDGCEHCYQGRSGRTVLVEIVDADAHVMHLLSKAEMDKAREYWLSPHGLNGVSMLWHGIEKVMAGMLSPIDTEFELGPLATPQEIAEVQKVLGVRYES